MMTVMMTMLLLSLLSFLLLSTFLVFLIVERGGLEGLLRLCERATEEGLGVVPFAWAMEAAGFKLGSEAPGALEEQLVRSIVAPLSRGALFELVIEDGSALGRYIALEYAEHFKEFDGEHFVKFSNGTLRSIEGVNLPIFDLSQDLRDATRAHWPVREHTAPIIEVPRAFRR